MGRWEPDAQGRLRRAALALYADKGYDTTTVAEIAARAGVTERTFFRYFADKREVLFEGSSFLEVTLVEAIRAAPAGTGALDVIGAAVLTLGEALPDRDYARQRAAVIAAEPSLQERELLKLSTMSDAAAAALVARGTDPTPAALAADLGVTVFRVGFQRWIAPAETADLTACLAETFAEVKALAA
jgi:AcrR family transcriptional regulator